MHEGAQVVRGEQTAYALVKAAKTVPVTVMSGVSQGTVLGPALVIPRIHQQHGCEH